MLAFAVPFLLQDLDLVQGAALLRPAVVTALADVAADTLVLFLA